MLLIYGRLIVSMVLILSLPQKVFCQNSDGECSVPNQDTSNKIRRYPEFYLPLTTLRVTSSYGHRTHPVTGKSDFHKGVDLAAHGKLVFSVLPGVVAQAGYNLILGNFIRINHSGATSIYGHLSILLIHKGDLIMGGQAIAITGSTGRVTGEHLHFSIKVGEMYVDPLLFLFSLHSY